MPIADACCPTASDDQSPNVLDSISADDWKGDDGTSIRDDRPADAYGTSSPSSSEGSLSSAPVLARVDAKRDAKPEERKVEE